MIVLPKSFAFDGRSALTFSEIAERLACTPAHISNLVARGFIVRGKAKIAAALDAARVPAADYRRFLASRCTSKAPDFSPSVIPWGEIDFESPNAITVDQIGEKLAHTGTHISHVIEAGRLIAYDLRGKEDARSYYRIPVEAYRRWIVSCITKPKAAVG